jgi:hypothetical protein
MSITDEDIELQARDLASTAYHEHPSNPSDCRKRIELGLDDEGTRCPCEDGWRDWTKAARTLAQRAEEKRLVAEAAEYAVRLSELTGLCFYVREADVIVRNPELLIEKLATKEGQDG